MATTSPYRIGVIADTHDRWLPRVAELFKDVDEIWHLGDACQENILDELRAINPKLSVVLGNNDLSLTSPYRLELERSGEKFHLVHIPPRVIPPGCDWLLYGHTHRPVNEIQQGVHIFNPGSAGKANKGAPLSLGFLTKEPGKKFQCSIVLL